MVEDLGDGGIVSILDVLWRLQTMLTLITWAYVQPFVLLCFQEYDYGNVF